MGLTYRKLSITVLLAVTACFFSGCGYNTMQQNEEAVQKAWGDVESTLQRRADLIPNLVETVKGYAGHEKTTLENVVQARSKAVSAQGVEAQGQAEGEQHDRQDAALAQHPPAERVLAAEPGARRCRRGGRSGVAGPCRTSGGPALPAMRAAARP